MLSISTYIGITSMCKSRAIVLAGVLEIASIVRVEVELAAVATLAVVGREEKLIDVATIPIASKTSWSNTCY